MSNRKPPRQKEEKSRAAMFEEEWADFPHVPLSAGLEHLKGTVELFFDSCQRRVWGLIYSRESSAAERYRMTSASSSTLGALVAEDDSLREFKQSPKFKMAIKCISFFQGFQDLCASRLFKIFHDEGSIHEIIPLVLSNNAGRTGQQRTEITVLTMLIFASYRVMAVEPMYLFENVLNHIPDANPNTMEYTAIVDEDPSSRLNALLNWALVETLGGDTFPKENTALAKIVAKLCVIGEVSEYMSAINDLAEPTLSVEGLQRFITDEIALPKFGFRRRDELNNVVPAGTQVIPLNNVVIQAGIQEAGESITENPAAVEQSRLDVQAESSRLSRKLEDYIKSSGSSAQWSRLGSDVSGRRGVLASGILPNYQNLAQGDSQRSIESTESMTAVQADGSQDMLFDPIHKFTPSGDREGDPYVLSQRNTGLGISTLTQGEIRAQQQQGQREVRSMNPYSNVDKYNRLLGEPRDSSRDSNSNSNSNSNSSSSSRGNSMDQDNKGGRRRKTRKIKKQKKTKKAKKFKKSKKSRKSRK